MIESRNAVIPDPTPATSTDVFHQDRHPLGVQPPQCIPFEGPIAGRSFVGANLQGISFAERDMRHADLRGADLFMACLDGADLRGTIFDMTRIVEILVPSDLPLQIVNQIRAFDFVRAQTRVIAPNRLSDTLPCPYARSTLRPILYQWGSATWRDGAEWAPPRDAWTLEEIIAAVLSTLRCKHDLSLPHGFSLRPLPR
jgi:hypothetical protein